MAVNLCREREREREGVKTGETCTIGSCICTVYCKLKKINFI